MLDGITELARDAVTSAGYLGLFGAMLAENVFPPIPSEIVLPLAGFEVADGELSFVPTILAATAGSVAGAVVLYAVGLYGGRPLVFKWGRVLRVTPRDLERAEGWFERWGDWVVLIARVIPIARSIVSIPAGLTRMPVGRFLLLTTLGTAVWNVILVGGGQQLGSNWEDISDLISRWADVMLVLSVIALVAGVVYLRRRRRGSEPATPGGDG
jgi:membrane protein DedA with SNARE-associated domain